MTLSQEIKKWDSRRLAYKRRENKNKNVYRALYCLSQPEFWSQLEREKHGCADWALSVLDNAILSCPPAFIRKPLLPLFDRFGSMGYDQFAKQE